MVVVGVGGSAGFLLGRDRRDFRVARQRRDLVDRGLVDQARLGHFGFCSDFLVSSPAGYGTFSLRGSLMASWTVSQLPLWPGTEPLTNSRPRIGSVRTISRFCWVRLRAPMCPAIFLFLNTRPGSWRLPVEPCERCDSDTPWVARRPPKFQRFMAPAKPLPWVTPEMSTIWPAMK